MKKLFGTDGVRGEANSFLTPELAFNLGKVASLVIAKNYSNEENFIIIGKDTRQSGDMLESALSAGICSMGVNVVNLGVVPTPVVAWLVKNTNAISGIMISASHNPAKDNGIKFFNHNGKKIANKLEIEIETMMEDLKSTMQHRASGENVGRVSFKPELADRYIDFLKEKLNYDLSGLKILVDTANGSNSEFAQKAFDKLGITAKIINNEPNGKNINYKCGSTCLDPLKKIISEEKFDIGLAFDGDADRLLAVDDNGNEINGDQIMYICSKYLPILSSNKTIVATVMSNLGFENAIKNMGKGFIRAQVGDRYVSEQIDSTGAKIGGEQSGHIIFPELNSSGDGLLSAILLLEALHRSSKKLSQLKKEFSLFPQILINVPVNNKEALNTCELIKKTIENSENVLGNDGRVLVRPSGTESLVRVMVEGKEQALIQKHADDIANVIRRELSIA